MTNDPALRDQMTKEIRITKLEIEGKHRVASAAERDCPSRSNPPSARHLDFRFRSSFAIRHLAFVIFPQPSPAFSQVP
jgi:hypothetical protein